MRKNHLKQSRQQVIERLRKSQHTTDEEFRTLGNEAGREWASEYAKAIELRRLEKAQDSEDGLEFCSGFDQSAAERFVSIIEPEAERPATAASEFWEMFSDSRETPEDSYVAGFAAGAMEVWDEVKGEL